MAVQRQLWPKGRIVAGKAGLGAGDGHICRPPSFRHADVGDSIRVPRWWYHRSTDSRLIRSVSWTGFAKNSIPGFIAAIVLFLLLWIWNGVSGGQILGLLGGVSVMVVPSQYRFSFDQERVMDWFREKFIPGFIAAIVLFLLLWIWNGVSGGQILGLLGGVSVDARASVLDRRDRRHSGATRRGRTAGRAGAARRSRRPG